MLLPTEADLCNALGITEEEYFQFLEGVAAKIKERPEAYGLVPDLVAGPAAIAPFYAGGSLTFLGQIAVGVALTAASVLLAPKPPSMRQGTQQRTADVGGTKKFAPQFSFNSVQDLANLGDLIPLIFTNRQKVDDDFYGGIRVNSQLIWSQMVSLGSSQQLKILALFSLGEIARKPDLKGYAIGDLLLESYHAEKIYTDSTDNIPFQLNAIPTNEGDNIPFPADPDEGHLFRIDDFRYFSGTRNPTTQATFGLSNPMPNATAYMLPYELVRTASDVSDADSRPAGRIALKKRRKLLGAWPMGAGFMNGGTTNQKEGKDDLQKDLELHYQIVGSTDSKGTPFSGIAYKQDAPPDTDLTSDPHGLEDVNSATKTVREATDSYLAVGEQYMAGSALVTCVRIEEEGEIIAGAPWDGTKIRNYFLKVIESGKYHAVLNGELETHLSNPRWKDGTNDPGFEVQEGDRNKFYYLQDYRDIFNPSDRYALQKATLGTISNNRRCHITEIGIKSKVFKQIQFANVNSKPEEEDIATIYDNRSTLQLGNINKYINRYSFFKLQVREIGQDDWVWLKPSTNLDLHTGLFCVKGNTPEFQYNYIRIVQPHLGQYEYRFYPWPGAAVVEEVKEYESISSSRRTPVIVCLLNTNATRKADSIKTFKSGDFHIKYAGSHYALTKQNVSNTEWNLGAPNKVKLIQASNKVTSFRTTQASKDNKYSIINLPFTRETRPVFTNKIYYPGYGGYPANWESLGASAPHHTVIGRFDDHPAPGWTTWSLYINNADVTPNIEGRRGPAWPWHEIREPGNTKPVEFHYTGIDPATGQATRGGKFTPATNPTVNNLYAVTKTEQLELTATATFNGEINVSSLPGEGGTGLKARVTTYALGTEWFASWGMTDSGVANSYENGQIVKLVASQIGLPSGTADITFAINTTGTGDVYGDEIGSSQLNPYDAISDMWQYEGDKSSHLEGPEHQITYCNEIIETEGSTRAYGKPATYENLAYAGLRINSSKEWTSFSQFSAYFKEGVKVKSLIDGTRKATNLFPEIAYALLTDKTLGAGAVISESSVDEGNMTIAAKFCKANKFFWDGMIADRVNLREFIYQQALYCLLDFTIIGGKFSLYPAVPFDPNTFKIDLDGDHSKPKIKAMFTDGNISDLSVSFLSPEDRQAFKANVLYRMEEENGFPEVKSTVVRLAEEKDADGNVLVSHVDDPLETFDLSGFCTSSEAARWFARYTLVLRKHLDHTISFKTAPHYINGVRPGDYIRVFSTTQHVQRFNNGAILDDGTVVCKDLSELTSGSQPKDFYYWNPSTIVAGEIMPVTEATVDFSDTNAVKAFAGSLFTIKESEASDQCYKVESITFGDDGLVELTGSYAELTADGKLAMLQNWSSSSTLLFVYED